MSKEVKIKVSPVLTTPLSGFDEFYDESESLAIRRIPAVYSYPSIAGYFRPWRFTPAERSGVSKVFYAKTTKLRIMLDVDNFDPKTLQITNNGKVITIEGRHDEVPDRLGTISRWMKRQYKVPPDVKMDTVTDAVKKKGTIVIMAERNLEDSLGKENLKLLRDEIPDQSYTTSTTTRSTEPPTTTKSTKPPTTVKAISGDTSTSTKSTMNKISIVN